MGGFGTPRGVWGVQQHAKRTTPMWGEGSGREAGRPNPRYKRPRPVSVSWLVVVSTHLWRYSYSGNVGWVYDGESVGVTMRASFRLRVEVERPEKLNVHSRGRG